MTRKFCECDICGKQMSIFDKWDAKVKIKKKSIFGNWIKYDICEDCQKDFTEWIKEKNNITNG